jgi:hypothetical protein
VCLQPADWPESDRLAWERATAPRRGPFRARGGGRTRSPASVRKVASGYGIWMGFLSSRNDLHQGESPAERPTAERLDAWFAYLRDRGNSDFTIVGRFAELRIALQWPAPGRDFGWIERPRGLSLRTLLPMRRRSVPVPDSAELLGWAEDLFRRGLAHHKPRCRQALVREAVLIGLLATRAPRLRALASLRLGVHLRRDGDEWVLDQDPSITKTGRSLVLPLPAEVAVMLERYLVVERRELLGDAEHDAL